MLIGTSGYSFKDWRGRIYPANLKEADLLAYYENDLGFNTVEINYTYYSQPRAATSESMCRRTSEGFLFSVKAHKTLTHEFFDMKSRERRDNKQDIEEFLAGIEPFRAHQKLLCVLAQFPPWMMPRPENKEYITVLRDALAPTPLVIEFRNRIWHNEETFEFLAREGLGYCVVDEPPFPNLLPYDPRATTDLAYIRWHGRSEAWYKGSEERYNYLYSRDELASFLPSLRGLGEETRTLAGYFNNCHAGAAATNASMLKDLLGLPGGAAKMVLDL
jgi:uncharacterized protein YecE (DUF72 family)